MSGHIQLWNFRCDGRIHCKDASDEDMCDKIVVPDSYLNEVPVPPLTNEPLAKILLEVEIISVQELIEVDAIMTLQYKLSFKWMDSRITFQNLKSFDFLNTVATYDAQKIWHPNVVFFNLHVQSFQSLPCTASCLALVTSF